MVRCRGRLTAFYEAFFQSKVALIRHICLGYLNDPDEADDATGDILEKVIKKLPGANVTNFDAWLYRVAKTTAIDHLRTFTRQHHLPIEEAPEVEDPSPSQEELVLNDELRVFLQQQLSTLPTHQRQVVELRQVLSAKETADLLGQREGWVNVTYLRGLRALRTKVTGRVTR
jgi:RNA polymerase sigma factor (sigma-70 family)